MTPAELDELIDLFNRRERRLDERFAVLAHHILCGLVGSKKAPTVDVLLGRVTKL